MARTRKLKHIGYVEVKGECFGYDAIRTNEAGETEYHLEDSDEWCTYVQVEAYMDELLAEEAEQQKKLVKAIKQLSKEYRLKE